MKANLLNDNFINVLNNKFPKKSELANKLMDILFIEKEAIYRRLRGEVLFSFFEIAMISDKLGISLDSIIGLESSRSRPFYIKLTNYIDPQEIDLHMVDEYMGLLKEIRNESNTETGAALKMIPDVFHLRYKHISKFYLFKWVYQYNNPEVKRPFREINSDKMLNKLGELRLLLHEFKEAYYIFDKRIFQNFVDDLNYFVSIKLIEPEELKILKGELLELIDYLESLAISGKNEAGNKVSFFISDVNFETDFSYIESQNYKLSLVRSFTLYDIASLDEKTLAVSKKWLQSLKRTSTLISESGELQRMDFFNSQREIINTL